MLSDCVYDTMKLLNKKLWTSLTKLKLLSKSDASDRFILDKSPFMDDESEEETSVKKNECVIIGRIFPNSGIYREGAYKIVMKLAPSYPHEPPKVRFLTPIYHPNVNNDGK